MLLEQLEENLRIQVEQHRELLEYLRQEGDLPTSCTLQELEAIQEQRDQSAANIAKLEQERITITGEQSLKTIMEDCQQDVRDRMFSFRDDLMELIEEIRTIAQDNAEQGMIRKNCIQEVRNVLHRSLKQQMVYSKHGKMTKASGPVVLQRAI